jgi:RNA polymerase sigma-70 factor (ECF subfamily)
MKFATFLDWEVEALIDEQLIERCRQGEELALEELVSYYHKPVYNYIYGFTGDKELTEDIVQETFIKLINNIDKYKQLHGTKFSTWLFSGYV